MAKTKYIPSEKAENSPKLLTGIGDKNRAVGWGGDYLVYRGKELVRTFSAECSEDTDKYFDTVGVNATRGTNAIAVLAEPTENVDDARIKEAEKRAQIVNQLSGEDLTNYIIDNKLDIDTSSLKNDKQIRAAIINHKL